MICAQTATPTMERRIFQPEQGSKAEGLTETWALSFLCLYGGPSGPSDVKMKKRIETVLVYGKVENADSARSLL